MTVETIKVSDQIRIRIEHDDDPESPADWDNVGEIAYVSRSRNTLGTESVSSDRMDEIAQGIEDGSLIGLPVYAYVHGGSTISTKPFSDIWDSGRSGFVYCTRAKAVKEFGKILCTQNVIDRTLQCLRGEVETFAQYLEGDVYGYIIELAEFDADGEIEDYTELGSCWGFYGQKYCADEARGEAAHEVRKLEKEELERGYWSARDVITIAA